jgi:hypothetical protein
MQNFICSGIWKNGLKNILTPNNIQVNVSPYSPRFCALGIAWENIYAEIGLVFTKSNIICSKKEKRLHRNLLTILLGVYFRFFDPFFIAGVFSLEEEYLKI